MLKTPVGQFTRDAGVGAAVFAGLAAAFGGASSLGGGFLSGAEAAALAQRSSEAVAAQAWVADGRLEILVILAMSFTLMFALNLAFMRHLRRAHAKMHRRSAADDTK